MPDGQMIPFGEMRQAGATSVEFCRDFKCAHSIKLPADSWPDEMQLSDAPGQAKAQA